jgi:zinc/manganese transport system ATP-binding protein
VRDASVLLPEEPFTAIDARTTSDLLRLIHAWNGEGRTVVGVLHDLDQVRAHFPDTLLMAREPISWGATSEVLTAANQRRARDIAENWDEQAGVCAVPSGPERTVA